LTTKKPVRSDHKNCSNGIVNFIMLVTVFFFAALFLFPFYWMVSSAFKVQMVAISIPPEWFPKEPTLANLQLLGRLPVGRWFFNSILVALTTTFLVCATSAMAGYSLAKKVFPGRDLIFWIFVAVMTLPKQVILVPLFIMMRKLNLFDTYPGLILPAVGWPFGIFLMKQFTQTLPSEILQAAAIDGCSEIQKFTKMVLPLVKPGIGALAIFTFMSCWNDYFWQLIMLKSTLMKTLPLGVAGMQEEYGTNYGLLMAGSALASIPMITIFLVFQKYFTQGITMGAVKG
jgi:multiple sugar transport system permease protein